MRTAAEEIRDHERAKTLAHVMLVILSTGRSFKESGQELKYYACQYLIEQLRKEFPGDA